MRRRYFYWTFLVVAILLTAYGGYLFVYNLVKGNGFSPIFLVLAIAGIAMLVTYLILYLITVTKAKKEGKEKGSAPILEKEKEKEVLEDAVEARPVSSVNSTKRLADDCEYVRSSPSSERSYETVYVKKVGYGPVLRISGNQVVDMRSNTYYRIQGNIVYQEGSGPAFEISGDRIRASFGSYLYELSGSNVNKTFGGFFASFSGGYLVKYDGSERYEITDSLNASQKLTVVALLFE